MWELCDGEILLILGTSANESQTQRRIHTGKWLTWSFIGVTQYEE